MKDLLIMLYKNFYFFTMNAKSYGCLELKYPKIEGSKFEKSRHACKHVKNKAQFHVLALPTLITNHHIPNSQQN